MKKYLHVAVRGFLVIVFIQLLTLLVKAENSATAKERSGSLKLGLTGISPAAAEAISRTRGTFGIGFVLGEPTGVSWKYWLGPSKAVDGAFGYSFGDNFRVSANYIIHENAFEIPDFPLYYGIGGAISGSRGYIARSQRGDFALGVRGVIGVSYLFKRAPLDAFLEVAPIVFIAPPLGLSIDFCFGMRVYP